MDFFIQSAYAQGAEPASPLGMLPMMLIIFAAFYFLLIRPQNKRQKEHREMVANLATGDEVVTAGGVLGKVIEVGEQFVKLQIADGVEIKVQRHTVGAVMPKGTIKSA